MKEILEYLKTTNPNKIQDKLISNPELYSNTMKARYNFKNEVKLKKQRESDDMYDLKPVDPDLIRKRKEKEKELDKLMKIESILYYQDHLKKSENINYVNKIKEQYDKIVD